MRKLPMLTKSFIGFSVFLIIPLMIAGFIFYYNLVRYSENEISKSSIVNLQNVKKLNDQLIDSITKQTIRLSLDILIQEILDVKKFNNITDNPEKMIKFMQVVQILSETVNINSRVKSIYVYLNDSDYVMTSSQGVITKDTFTDDGWFTEYDQKKNEIGTIWLNSRPLGDANTSNAINVISCILPLKKMINSDGAIVVNISEPELYNYMNESNTGSDGYVFVMNDNGTVISHNEKNLINKSIADKPYIKSILQSELPAGFLISENGSGKQMFTYYKSEFNHWIYVGVMPMNSLLEKTNSLLSRVLLFLFGIMLIGIILSYFLSRSMYNPVKKLMQDIQKRRGINFREAGNEMAVISRAFDSLSRQEDALSSELEKNKHQLQNKYIIDLIEGNTDKTANQEVITEIELKFEYFMCLLLAIDKYDSFKEKHAPDRQYYLKMMVLKTCEEITTQFFTVYGILYEKNKIAIILNSEGYHPEETHEQLYSCLRALQKEIGKVMSNTITVGAGKWYDNINKLSTSFLEAKEALSNRIIEGNGSIIFYKNISESENKYFYPYQTETHILNFLKLGSREELLGAIDDLILEIRERKGISSDNIIQIFVQLIGNTVKYMVEMNINIGNIFGSDYNIYQKLSSKETLEDIKIWLTGFYSGILKFMAITLERNRSNAADRVMDFLHKNYGTNIDTTSIAANTNLGYSTIGRIVKNKTGKNVLEYLNGLRIEEAKRLLRQTNMNIVDIALHVGYNNDQSFSRFFRKFEGVTPGEFRNLQDSK